jgi:hypothetical protein
MSKYNLHPFTEEIYNDLFQTSTLSKRKLFKAVCLATTKIVPIDRLEWDRDTGSHDGDMHAEKPERWGISQVPHPKVFYTVCRNGKEALEPFYYSTSIKDKANDGTGTCVWNLFHGLDYVFEGFKKLGLLTKNYKFGWLNETEFWESLHINQLNFLKEKLPDTYAVAVQLAETNGDPESLRADLCGLISSYRK